MSDCPSAPKADALPGCATPRTAEALRFPADLAQAESDVRGNVRQNRAGTYSESPGKSRNLTPAQLATVATVFWFTSIGAGLLAAWFWFRNGRNVK